MPRATPRLLPGQCMKFGSIHVLPNGRLRFSAWTLPGLPHLDFVANHWSFPEDGPVYDPANYHVTAHLRGQPVFFLHIKKRRVESALFAYNLTSDTLREAVAALRDAGNGIEQWITPGLAHMQADLTEMPPDPHREALKAIIPELLRSVRSIPIAKSWEPLRRDWERWKREQARKAKRDTPAKKPP